MGTFPTEFVIDVNLKRRHLTIPQRVELGMRIEGIEKDRAKERMRLSEGRGIKKVGELFPTLNDENDDGRATTKVASKVGVSRKTYERGRVVFKEALKVLQINNAPF